MRIKWLLYTMLLVVCTGCQGKNAAHAENSIEVTDHATKGPTISTDENQDKEEKDTEKEGTENQEDKDKEKKEEPSIEKKIDAYVSQMSEDEKIGQLLFIDIRKDEQGSPITSLDEHTAELIRTYHVGGIILFKENIQTAQQTKKLIGDLQKTSDIPLFVGVDEEGGIVSRVGSNSAICQEPFKEAFLMGQTKDTSIAYQEATRMGKVLYELGFNMDFAPDADIYNEPSNTVIGRRSFGTTEEEVTPMVIAFAKGLEDQKIIPVIKHFPGHGNTKEDSHTGLAYVNKSLEELEKEEILKRPYLQGWR